jgi:hypothetical protein
MRIGKLICSLDIGGEGVAFPRVREKKLVRAKLDVAGVAGVLLLVPGVTVVGLDGMSSPKLNIEADGDEEAVGAGGPLGGGGLSGGERFRLMNEGLKLRDCRGR